MLIREDTGRKRPASKGLWENVETFARGKVQEFLQALLEEEVTELLGRAKSQRRAPAEPAGREEGTPVYRNGYGKLRRLCLTNGTVEVRRPRVRGLEERFESRILPLFARRTQQVAALLPQL